MTAKFLNERRNHVLSDRHFLPATVADPLTLYDQETMVRVHYVALTP